MTQKLKGTKKFVSGRFKLEGQTYGDTNIDILTVHVPSMDIVKADKNTLMKGKSICYQ